MASSLAWLDFDPSERERMNKILALFREKETRDEMGIGGIRDSIADQLFPGTSTIQSHLRYMLFVPWIYDRIEKRKTPSREISARARALETSLVKPLLESEDYGVFGKLAGGELKRLPSSVYWAGLGSWKIRICDRSQEDYHRTMDALYRLRAKNSFKDDGEIDCNPLTVTWHPKLPQEPPDFPDKVNFQLTREEAEFLRDRLVQSHPKSLFAYLTLNSKPAAVDFPWLHPDYNSFGSDHKELLTHARTFSEVIYGSAILYNLMLAEEPKDEEKIETLSASFATWASELNTAAIEQWGLERFWQLTLDHGHTITFNTMRFVQFWVMLVKRDPKTVASSQDARKLVRNREMHLKGARSRFTNKKARNQWRGAAGLLRLTYRWPTARTFLSDMYEGLARGE